MNKFLIRDIRIINEGADYSGSILVLGERIEKIFRPGQQLPTDTSLQIIDGKGKVCIPGIIDDQVHFREPGLTHKADIASESAAAVAGGVTSYMEMPNTNPQTTTIDLLDQKFEIASASSVANYSFYLGATNTNLDQLIALDNNNVCGIKVFLGASTGNMLVDNPHTLEKIFSRCKTIIATHCEDENIIRDNTLLYIEEFGDDIPIRFHPLIRSTEACYKSSSFAAGLARKHDTRLHILHLSTAEELSLFDSSMKLSDKRITSEVCVHHLWFDDNDYNSKGTFIKWNPAVKKESDKLALRKGLIENAIDVVATDHAPHTKEEKSNPYTKAPSGGPLVQHSLSAMLELCHKGVFSLGMVVEKMCHNPAILFGVKERGFLREKYYADLVILDLHNPWEVSQQNILYKCGWSPFEGNSFKARVEMTFVNGNLVYDRGIVHKTIKGKPLNFSR